MPVPSLDCLRTPANGQILAIEKPLSKSAVEAAFTTASARSSGRAVVREVRQKRTTKDGDCWASFVSFPITDTPAFFPSTAQPPDLDELSLYETYIRKCIERKWDLLEGPDMMADPQEILVGLFKILLEVAEELQRSEKPNVSLRKYREEHGDRLVGLLWKITETAELTDDAQARIGGRSLLSRVPGAP